MHLTCVLYGSPRILTIREQVKVVASLALARLQKVAQATFPKWEAVQRLPARRTYVPNFKKCIQHFCIHAGGRAVIDGIEENLGLETFGIITGEVLRILRVVLIRNGAELVGATVANRPNQFLQIEIG